MGQRNDSDRDPVLDQRHTDGRQETAAMRGLFPLIADVVFGIFDIDGLPQQGRAPGAGSVPRCNWICLQILEELWPHILGCHDVIATVGRVQKRRIGILRKADTRGDGQDGLQNRDQLIRGT